MENSEEKSKGGRPSIPGLTGKFCHLDEEDLSWFKERYKSRVLPDGTKDSVDAALRRLMREHRDRIEAEEALAEKRQREGRS